jgi:hypothetical protein
MEICKEILENPVTKDNLLFFLQTPVNKYSCYKVNKEVMIPINKVVAKPLIGPEPKINNTAPVIYV